jgi:hypothetical protein
MKMETGINYSVFDIAIWYDQDPTIDLIPEMTDRQILAYRAWSIGLALRYLKRRRKRLPIWYRILFTFIWIGEDKFIRVVNHWIANPTEENAMIVRGFCDKWRTMTTGHDYIQMAMSIDADQIPGTINRAVGFSTWDLSVRVIQEHTPPATMMGAVADRAQSRAAFIFLLRTSVGERLKT